MPRGPTTRSIYRKAKAEEKAKLQARREDGYASLTQPKKFMHWVKTLLEDHASEIPEWVAIVGTTYLVKRAIDLSEELRGRLEQIKTGIQQGGAFPPIIATAMFTGVPSPKIAPEYMRKKALEYEGMFPDWMDWLIAFSLAVIIVKHAGQIAIGLGEIASNLTKLVGFFLI